MKKNQLLGVLSFMMVLGMTFPAGLFATNSTSQPASHSANASSQHLSTSVNASAHASATSKTGIIPHAERYDNDEDENSPDKDKNKSKNRPKTPKKSQNAPKSQNYNNSGNSDNSGDEGLDVDVNDVADNSVAVSPTPTINPQIVRSYDELTAILTEPDYAHVAAVRLTNDIIITHNGLEISRDNFTIDLNGHSIISCGAGNGLCEDYARVLDVKSGNFTITGAGNIMAMGQGGVALSVRGSSVESSANYATVNIGPEVILRAPSSYGLIVIPSGNSAYGVTINLAGKISAENGIYINSNIQTASSNSPTFNFANTSSIEADQAIIYAAGFGIWNFHGGEFSGATGIRAKAGDFIFDQAHIVTQVASLNDASASGAVFQIEESNADGLTITIHDGYYESYQACVFADYNETEIDGALNALTIDGGTFVSPEGIFSDFATGEDSLVAINGGIFSADITDFLASGTHLEPDSNGFWRVVDEAAVELSALRTKLQTLVDSAGAKNPDYFSDSTYQNLMTALVDAVYCLKNPESTLKQVRKNFTNLSTALDDLESIETPDQIALETARAELTERIAAAEALSPIDYDVDDFAHILELILESKKMVVDENVTLDVLEDMIVELEVEMEMLMPIDEDQAFEAAQARLEDSVRHTNQALEEVDSSNPAYTELLAVLFDANNLLADEAADATLSQLVQSYNQLEALRQNLFEAPATSEVSAVSNLPTAPSTLDTPEDSELLAPDLQVDNDNDSNSAELELDELDADEFLDLVIDDSPTSFTLANDDVTSPISSEPVNNDATVSAPLEPTLSESAPLEPAQSESDHTADELRTGVTEMLGAVIELTIGDYRPEFQNQFYDLGRAIEQAKLLLADPDANPAELAAIMNEILAATTGLKDLSESTAISSSQPMPTPATTPPATPPQPVLDFSVLSQLIVQLKQLNPASYTEASYRQVLQILQQARALSDNSATTQTDINNTVIALNNAIYYLQPVATSMQTNVATQNTYQAQQVQQTQQAAASSSAKPAHLSIADPDETVEPTVMMSILAGAYAGLATYRKNRLAAQKSRQKRKTTARAHR